MSERKGDWILTRTGRQFWPLDPREDDINIEDIAHALANKCRYSGHCEPFYSVAEHSVRVSQLVAAENALWGLLHDAGEAYLPDIPRPLKRCPEMQFMIAAEDRVMACVADKFGLASRTQPADVTQADAAILVTEFQRIMPWPWPVECYLTTPPADIAIEGWSPEEGKRRFLQRFEELAI